MLHNKVNTRLDKVCGKLELTLFLKLTCSLQEEFDCSQLEGLYDCGCAEDPDEMNEAEPNKTNLPAPKKVDDLTGDELVPGRRRL